MARLDLDSIAKVVRPNRGVDVGLGTFKKNMNRYNINTQPYYQRELRWTQQQKISFIENFLREVRMPNIIVNQCNLSDEGKVIDGQQRINAIIDFLDDKVEVFGGYVYSQIDGISDFCNIRFEFTEFKTEKECVRYYLDMIEGTTGHTELEVKKAMDYYNSL